MAPAGNQDACREWIVQRAGGYLATEPDGPRGDELSRRRSAE